MDDKGSMAWVRRRWQVSDAVRWHRRWHGAIGDDEMGVDGQPLGSYGSMVLTHGTTAVAQVAEHRVDSGARRGKKPTWAGQGGRPGEAGLGEQKGWAGPGKEKGKE